MSQTKEKFISKSQSSVLPPRHDMLSTRCGDRMLAKRTITDRSHTHGDPRRGEGGPNRHQERP